MIIGVPKEIKKEEYRVGLIPDGVEELKRDGHTILAEKGAGEGSGFPDEEYVRAGADIVERGTLFGRADLIVKVKEPLPQEYDLIKEGQAIFTFLHLAPNRELTELLLKKKVTGIGYETIQKNGGLPLLSPMSEVAGRMAPLVGAFYLQRIHGGKGILPSGVAGVKPARALILGAGVVGTNAARACLGLQMETLIMNRSMEGLQRVDELFGGRVKTLPLTQHHMREEIREADLIIGAVLVPGGRTPVLITRSMLHMMGKGTVIVDVSVDQGGCVETSRPTFHDNPVYAVEGIIHYAVANMPGAYPRTSTLALTNATLPYVKVIANRGVTRAMSENQEIRCGLNTYRGNIAHKALAESMGVVAKSFEEIKG